MDLLDFFRGEFPWAKLARFLRQLPPGSRYQAAIDADFDIAEYTYARQQLDADGDGRDEGESGPQVSTSAGYDLSVQTLMTIADLIQQLQATLVAVNLPEGKAPPKPRFLPRPVTALDVVRARHAVDEEVDQVGDALSAFGF
ncbi:hypothetical protein ACFWVM_28940 [Nocardia fluminea]|uniref:hypothetical protein n=1 Tax=Nocardia fluminea TaxID=134984 RepID=UPI00364E802E